MTHIHPHVYNIHTCSCAYNLYTCSCIYKIHTCSYAYDYNIPKTADMLACRNLNRAKSVVAEYEAMLQVSVCVCLPVCERLGMYAFRHVHLILVAACKTCSCEGRCLSRSMSLCVFRPCEFDAGKAIRIQECVCVCLSFTEECMYTWT